MSEITAVGPRLGIFGPPPQPPSRSLLTTNGVLQPADSYDGRWLNGLNLQSYPNPNDTTIWVPCAESPDDKDEEASSAQSTFDPAVIYLKAVCSTISGEYDRQLEFAVAALEAGTPKAIETLLASGTTGVGGNTNPFLGDGNVVIPFGGPFAPRDGLALLEDDAACRYGAKYMIHATPGTVDMLSSILEEDDSGDIYTQAGTCIIPETGLCGATAGGDEPSDNQAWIFASSPVQVFMTDIVTRPLVQSLERSTNTVEFIVERFVLALWDTLLQTAVLVDYTFASS